MPSFNRHSVSTNIEFAMSKLDDFSIIMVNNIAFVMGIECHQSYAGIMACIAFDLSWSYLDQLDSGLIEEGFEKFFNEEIKKSK